MNLDTVLQQMKECGAYDTWGTKKEVKLCQKFCQMTKLSNTQHLGL